MNIILLSVLSFVLSCSTSNLSTEEGNQLNIIEVSPNKWTAFTKQNIKQLNSIYDLNPILFSKNLYIESKAKPKAFPNITLNTKYAQSPKKLLSALIHEELFWWRKIKETNFDQAIKTLESSYPKLSKKELELLLICHIEVNILEHYLGKSEADEVIQSKANIDKYFPWFYKQVKSKMSFFTKLAKRYQLFVVFETKN